VLWVGNGEDAKHLNGADVNEYPWARNQNNPREYVTYGKESGRKRRIILSIRNKLGPDQEVFVVRM
jgi:hypothetical protein